MFNPPDTPYLAAMAQGVDPRWPKFSEVRPLSVDEYTIFKNNTRILLQMHRDLQVFLCVLMNYREYRSVLESYNQQCGTQNGKTPSLLGGETMMLNMNRLIMNMLASVRSFLDFTTINLDHRHGKESERYKTFKNETSALYDSIFAYRFLYRLRNFVQHCGMPVGKFDISIVYNSAEALQEDSRSMEFHFSRDSLLASNFDWGKVVRSELLRMPEAFPISPLISEMIAHVEKLQSSQIRAELPIVYDSFQWLEKLALEASGSGGMPCVCIKTPSNHPEEEWNINIQPFPLELMEQLRKSWHSVFGVS